MKQLFFIYFFFGAKACIYNICVLSLQRHLIKTKFIMGYIKRLCHCGREYLADERNLKRGWGLSCSKSCAASKREMSKPGYDPKRVESNNTRRLYWNSPSIVGGSGRITGRTSEGYRIMDGVAYDEFDQPVYNVGGFKESEQGWDNHK